MHTTITTSPRPATGDHRELQLPPRNMGDNAIGALISWLYPVFGIRGASWFLGVAEWSLHEPRGAPNGQPPLVSEAITKCRRMTIIASTMITWQRSNPDE